MSRQRTIRQEITLEGIGLHTGNRSSVTFKPGAPGTGIRFVRADMPGAPIVTASFDNVRGTAVRGTTVGNEPAQIHTVEHILAAARGLDIDNMEVHVTNSEPPVFDGSARPIVEALRTTGVVEQQASRAFMTLTETVTYVSGQTKLTAYPYDGFKIDIRIGYDHPYLKDQAASFEITPESFAEHIAPARTFCFDYEIEALKNNGLAKGGDLSNALVVGLSGIHNTEPLRFDNEFARHKMLDLIGDLFLLGKPLKAHIVAERCGHNHNVAFVREIAKIGMNNITMEEPPMQPAEPTQSAAHQQPVASTGPGTVYDINDIKRIIPHRYPFLMIDRVKVIEEFKKGIGIKCVSGNEEFFQGHFPGQPVMPGVLIVEAMAQTSCVLLLVKPEYRGKLAYFMAIDNVKFRKPVTPGDVLELRVEVLRARERGGKVRGEAYVNETLVTEAEFLFAVVDNEGQK